MQLKLLHMSVSKMILYVYLACMSNERFSAVQFLWIVCNEVTLDCIVCFMNTYCFLQKLKLKLK